MYSIWTKATLPFYRSVIKTQNHLFVCYRELAQEVVIESKFDLYRLDQGPSEQSILNKEEATYALKTMNYIRRMENRAADLYHLRLINGFLHLYAGQEAVAVGMKMAMDKEDTVITAYRCHGFTVAFNMPARTVFAELMGRKTGVSKGKGGSMHMYAPRFYGGDGIVGGQVDRATSRNGQYGSNIETFGLC